MNDRPLNVLPACCVTSTRLRWTCVGGTSCSRTCSSVASSDSVIVVRMFDPPNSVPAPIRVSTTVAELPAPRWIDDTGARRVLCGVGKLDVDDVDRNVERDTVGDVDDRAVDAVFDVERDERVGGRRRPRRAQSTSSGRCSAVSASVDRRSPSRTGEPVERSVSTTPLTTTTRGPSSAGICWSKSAGTVGPGFDRWTERQLCESAVRRVPPRLVALGREGQRSRRRRKAECVTTVLRSAVAPVRRRGRG